MKTISITFERTERVEKEFEVTDAVYEEIRRTERIPDDLFDEMETILEEEKDDIEYDYSVKDYENHELVGWG